MSRVARQTTESKTALVLIERKGDEPRVDSRILAVKLGGEHQSSLTLIDRYLSDFEEFGVCAPSVDKLPGGSGGGRPARYYLLNESQSHLLLTYSKNTPKARTLKKELLRKFNEYRAKLNRIAKQRYDLSWQQERRAGKDVRHHLASTIEQFADYARAQGSEHPEAYFLNFSKLTNKRLGIEVPARGATRDTLDADTLRGVQAVEIVESAAILEAMSAGVHYKEVWPVAKARVEALNVVRLPPPAERKALPPGPCEQDLFGPEEA